MTQFTAWIERLEMLEWYKDRDFPEIKVSNAEILAVVPNPKHLHSLVEIHNAVLGANAKMLEAMRVMRGALSELQLGHVHNESEPDYRPLGDTYGWCSICTTKVGLNEDIARDALAKVEGIAGDNA